MSSSDESAAAVARAMVAAAIENALQNAPSRPVAVARKVNVYKAVSLPAFVQEHVDALDQAEEDCEVLKDELEWAQDELDNAEQDLTNLTHDFLVQKQQIVALQQVTSVQQAALFDLQAAHVSLTQEAEEQKEELIEREATQMVTDSRLEEMLLEGEQNVAERDAAYAEVLRVETRHRATLMAHAELEDAHAEAYDGIVEVAEQVQAERQQREAAEKRAAESEAKAADLEAENATLRAKLEQAERQILELKSTSSGAKTDITEVEDKENGSLGLVERARALFSPFAGSKAAKRVELQPPTRGPLSPLANRA